MPEALVAGHARQRSQEGLEGRFRQLAPMLGTPGAAREQLGDRRVGIEYDDGEVDLQRPWIEYDDGDVELQRPWIATESSSRQTLRGSTPGLQCWSRGAGQELGKAMAVRARWVVGFPDERQHEGPPAGALLSDGGLVAVADCKAAVSLSSAKAQGAVRHAAQTLHGFPRGDGEHDKPANGRPASSAVLDMEAPRAADAAAELSGGEARIFGAGGEQHQRLYWHAPHSCAR
eukprot:gene2799-3591_t